jgi:hypothetical protein
MVPPSSLEHVLTSVDYVFPLEISFPRESLPALHSVTTITIHIFQSYTFLFNVNGFKKTATASIPVTKSMNVPPSIQPQLVSIPISPSTLGRFTSNCFRISHTLRLTFHRRGVHFKFTWNEGIEIFQQPTGICDDVSTTETMEID